MFFGGGTPSLFPPEAIGRVLQAARRQLHARDPTAEVTLEANPGAIERGAFREYRAAGVTRVSLGAQSFDRGTARCARAHSFARRHPARRRGAARGRSRQLQSRSHVRATRARSRPARVRDVRGGTGSSPRRTSRTTSSRSSRGRCLPRSRRRCRRRMRSPPACSSECGELLAAAGFAHYEVSAYARPGARCRHNLNYWSFGDYLGVGAGAHGKLTFRGAARHRAHHAAARAAPLPRRRSAGARAARDPAASELPFEFMLNALRLTAGSRPPTFRARTGLVLGGRRRRCSRSSARARPARGDRDEAIDRVRAGCCFSTICCSDFCRKRRKTPELSAIVNGRARAFPRIADRPLFTGCRGCVRRMSQLRVNRLKPLDIMSVSH